MSQIFFFLEFLQIVLNFHLCYCGNSALPVTAYHLLEQQTYGEMYKHMSSHHLAGFAVLLELLVIICQ